MKPSRTFNNVQPRPWFSFHRALRAIFRATVRNLRAIGFTASEESPVAVQAAQLRTVIRERIMALDHTLSR